MALSPTSPLSSLSSDDGPEETRDSDREVSDDNGSIGALPPAKRRRIMKPTRASPDYESHSITMGNAADEWTDVSSDTTGSVPGSPRALKDLSMADEESIGIDQVRSCSWDGCGVRDLPNMDELVTHLNDEHVGLVKKQKFTCEWLDCKAKGKTQLSAYALKAHLRSHTKEKPFYCLLPECDRAFTRSDALAKHMRTVHEIESIRENHGKLATQDGFSGQPSNSAPSKPLTKLKLVLSSSKTVIPATPLQNSTEADTESKVPVSPLSPGKRDEVFGPFPPELAFTEDEAAMPRDQLYRLLRRQIHWAQQDSKALQDDLITLEEQRRREWMRKELVFENVLEAEFERLKKKGNVSLMRTNGISGNILEDGLNPYPFLGGADPKHARPEARRVLGVMAHDADLASHLPMNGQKRPWYRDPQWKNQPDPPEDDISETSEMLWRDDDWAEVEDTGINEEAAPGDDDTEVEEQGDGV